MHLILAGALLFTQAVFAKVDTSTCGETTLARKNCILHRGNHKIQFRGETISSFNGTHRSLTSIPVVGENVEWNKIGWKSIAGRQFVEMEIWEAPKTQGELSALRWIVFEVRGVALESKVDQVIRRRKMVADQKTYEMDKMKNHQVFQEKGHVRWKVDFESGELK